MVLRVRCYEFVREVLKSEEVRKLVHGGCKDGDIVLTVDGFVLDPECSKRYGLQLVKEQIEQIDLQILLFHVGKLYPGLPQILAYGKMSKHFSP